VGLILFVRQDEPLRVGEGGEKEGAGDAGGPALRRVHRLFLQSSSLKILKFKPDFIVLKRYLGFSVILDLEYRLCRIWRGVVYYTWLM
jgi:hypothetical protein